MMFNIALVAQRIEHLTTDQKVGGSSPSKRTSNTPKTVLPMAWAFEALKATKYPQSIRHSTCFSSSPLVTDEP